MEKKIEFLQSRTAAQLAELVESMSSDVRYEVVNNLEPITPDSDIRAITRHDRTCMTVISLCDSLQYVVNELKQCFV